MPRVLTLPFLFAGAFLTGTSAVAQENEILDTTRGAASWTPFVSADGLFAAFTSANRFSNREAAPSDVFVRNRETWSIALASASDTGSGSNKGSSDHAFSADGRFVAFVTGGDILVPNDGNEKPDLFFKEHATRAIERINVQPDGSESRDPGRSPAISADGRYVAFTSRGNDLVSGDTNASRDIFVRDRLLGKTERVSVDSLGRQARGDSDHPAISANGRFVVFESDASDLVRDDNNGMVDIFLHDRATGRTRLISTTTTGAAANGDSSYPEISADGSTVLYLTWADNVQQTQPMAFPDTVAVDLATGVTESINRSSSGQPGNGSTFEWPTNALSADGRYIAFSSRSTNLIARNTLGYLKAYRFDRLNNKMTLVSAPKDSARMTGGGYATSISADGSLVGFGSNSPDLLPGNPIPPKCHAYIREMGNGAQVNTVILAGDFLVSAGEPIRLTWCAAPAGSNFQILSSLATGLTRKRGHAFDLAAPLVVQASGVVADNGRGEWRSKRVSASLSGMNIHFEMGFQLSNGQIRDSILHTVVVN